LRRTKSQQTLAIAAMGSDAEIFLFDHQAYTTLVVPAFLELFGTGRIADWLRPLLARRKVRPELWDRTDLSRFLAGLKPDLSWLGPYDLKDTFGRDWPTGWVESIEGDPPTEDTAEQVNWLFEKAVEIKCLGPGQFVGRSATVSYYSNVLSQLGVKENDRTVDLLAALGKRGYLIGYKFGFGFEGINGWLEPAETGELARRLETLPLPRYEISFAAMEQFRMLDWGSYKCEGFSFEALTLSFVRTVATIASGERRGLLWGNDVEPLIHQKI
jgi:hypothetical protein